MAQDVGDTIRTAAVFDCALPREIAEVVLHALGALGQHLECVLSGQSHNDEDAVNGLFRDILVKQVRHAVDEDQATFLPAQRLIEHAVDRLDSAVPLAPFSQQPVIGPIAFRHLAAAIHCNDSRRHIFGVAVPAAFTYTRATADRIPGCISPFDVRLISHGSPSEYAKI